MPITISICDDDSIQISSLKSILSEWSAGKPFAVHINTYESAEQFLFCYPDDPCDLLLLDIEMKGINGMELAKQLRAKGDMLPIVFITGFSEYMSGGYDVEALHYLLKPLNKDKLVAVLDRNAERYAEKSAETVLTTDSGTTHISTDRIVFVEAFGRNTQVHISDGRMLDCNMSIASFEGITGFIHTHRSYIVNLRFVKSIGKTAVMLDNGKEIPLSRRRYGEVNKKFIEFYTGE
ncbi:LytTR family DNA-binding domain-containing protein [Ruminococcus sp. Marseille-P6503]|uniref:LytR/AlgR family response regulator transcription factor n=1 Tax=Ruminococcus sp. Marseille-P6503 TaxID=2364796 RepID=UPI000F531540|nr:LytTR family DNA-binding domain-containing protein [Ruminococcus sp. Marseille-P6503]